MNLQPGQNISITGQSPTARSVEMVLSWEPPNTALEIDTSAFALDASGKVRDDDSFIFYNQPSLPDGGIQRSQDGKSFVVDFERLPATVEKIALALTLHEGQRRGHTFSQLNQVRVELRDLQSKQSLAVFAPNTAGMSETALIATEIYRRNNEWKFRAVGQGFVGGLGPLASNYGVDVAGEPEPPAPTAAPAPPPSPAPQPVRLDKITLEKKGQKISLEKKGQGFGEIVVNLNWTQKPASGGGFMNSLFGSGGKIDLDLGCLVELQNGQAGAIQALGNSFGSLDQPPFIQLMGDDRSGASAEGEFMIINGRYWDHIRRVLIFAFIYEGVPNWSAADAVVTLKTPGQPTLEVRLDEHRNDRGMCAIALLENKGGTIQVSKQVEYFRSHKPMDEAYGFGLRWQAGSKD